MTDHAIEHGEIGDNETVHSGSQQMEEARGVHATIGFLADPIVPTNSPIRTEPHQADDARDADADVGILADPIAPTGGPPQLTMVVTSGYIVDGWGTLPDGTMLQVFQLQPIPSRATRKRRGRARRLNAESYLVGWGDEQFAPNFTAYTGGDLGGDWSVLSDASGHSALGSSLSGGPDTLNLQDATGGNTNSVQNAGQTNSISPAMPTAASSGQPASANHILNAGAGQQSIPRTYEFRAETHRRVRDFLGVEDEDYEY